MAIDIWTGDVSGDWSNGANWSLGASPGGGDTAELIGGATPFVVTYDGTSASVAEIIGAATATLVVASGTLTVSGVNATSILAGNLVLAGGTLNVGTNFSFTEINVLGSTTLAAGATAFIASYGTLLINDGTLAGVLPADSGAIELVGTQAVTLEPGFVPTVFDFNLGVDGTASGSNVLLETDLDVTDYLNMFVGAGTSTPSIALNGHTITVASATGIASLLSGAITGPGSVAITGSADLRALSLSGGASLAAAAGSSVTLGRLVSVASGAAFGDAGIYLSGSVLAALPSGVSNASGTAYLGFQQDLALQATTGFLSGTIVGSSSGHVLTIGAGNFFVEAGFALVNSKLGFGLSQTAIASATTFETDYSFAGVVAMTLASSAALGPTLALNGHTIAFSGTADTLAGTISGPGALIVSGAAVIDGLSAANGATVAIADPTTIEGALSVVSGGTIDAPGLFLSSGALASIPGSALFSAATIALGGIPAVIDAASGILAGTFMTPQGSSGTLDLDSGSFVIAAGAVVGATNFTLGVSAAGVASATTLESNLSLAASNTFDLVQAGGVSAALDLNGFTLTLGDAAAELQGIVAGAGTLVIAGTADIAGLAIGGGALLVDGRLTQSGALALNETLQIDASGTYALGAGATTSGAGALTNNGLITTLANAPSASLTEGQVTNNGKILAGAALSIAANVAGAGTLAIAAGATLALGQGFSNTAVFNGAGATLQIGNVSAVAGQISGFGVGETIDLAGAANAQVGLAVANATSAVLTLNGVAVALQGNYAGLTIVTQSDGAGGTDVLVEAAQSGGGGTLPSVSRYFTPAVAAQLAAAIAALMPAGTNPNVPSVSGGGSAAAISGSLNALVVASATPVATTTLPSGFAAGYLLAANAALADTVGGAALIATAANDSLTGAGADTLFGGNFATTLTATSGAETLIGGNVATTFLLGAANAVVQSQGIDTISGSSGSATVNAAGPALYFGSSGASDINLQVAGTIIGGQGGNTVTGGAGAQLIFGVSTLTYAGGSGAASIIGGGGGNTITGGGGNLLAFASSSLTYAGTGGAATLIGGAGPMNAYLGAGGGIAYGGSGNDTLASGGGLSILVGGGQGDLLVATGAANDTLVAGGGAETLSGSGSTGALVLFGGPGDDVLAGGTGGNLFIAESGNETLSGGGSSDIFIFTAATGTTRTDVIVGFNPSADAIGLFGYGAEPGVDQAALASANVAGGNTNVSLSDGTTIVFVGAPTLNAYNFF